MRMQSDIAATFTESMRPQDSCRHIPAVVVGLPAIERARIRAGTMRTIPLTQGKFALVDGADFEWLNQWKWYAHKNPNTYYAERRSQGSKQMHRLILGLQPGDNQETDHRDGNGLNNQRSNLRSCTTMQNQQSSRRKTTGTSKYKGVCWHRGERKWHSKIRVNKKQIYLGSFESEIVAAQAYDAAALKYHREFALTNKTLGLY